MPRLLRCSWLLVASLTLGACVAAPSPTPPRSPLVIADVAGHAHRPLGLAAERPVVLIFVTVDCPIANAYAPEINRIVAEHAVRPVSFFLVHVDPDVTPDAARRHAEDYGFQCPVLVDDDHRLVRLTGATRTPEAAILTARAGGDEVEVRYRGRIDDRYVDFGRRRAAPSRHDLRDAIDAVLTGRPIAQARTEAIGCFISGPS